MDQLDLLLLQSLPELKSTSLKKFPRLEFRHSRVLHGSENIVKGPLCAGGGERGDGMIVAPMVRFLWTSNVNRTLDCGACFPLFLPHETKTILYTMKCCFCVVREDRQNNEGIPPFVRQSLTGLLN